MYSVEQENRKRTSGKTKSAFFVDSAEHQLLSGESELETEAINDYFGACCTHQC